tara:strand:+ start:897 stop:1019 length:123 start_codon:yes stop_codon:yes gene_type:complete
MHSIGKKVIVIGNKTKTGNMQHTNCPCVVNRTSKKKTKKA